MPLSTHGHRLVHRALLFAALHVLVSGRAGGQAATPRPPAAPGAAGEIRGRLVEAGSLRAVASGSITVRRAADTAFAGGALPREDGTFRVDGLPPGGYTLRVRVIGYAQLVRTNLAISSERPIIDLGTLSLTPVAVTLEQQTITAERSAVTLTPDRNSYSTKNMAGASGGTAIDVLRSVPSVEVDASNTLTLRGNQNVIVQVNGRTSPLRGEQLSNFLAQLPAFAVERVEVATSPSAKNDPEGTAGIINLVLRQEAGTNLSGGFNASVGSTRRTSLSGNLGRQSGPLTWFVSGNLSADRQPMPAISNRTNLIAPDPAFIDLRSAATIRPRSGTATVRSEYRLDPKDVLSFDGFVVGGKAARNNVSDFTNLDTNRVVIGSFEQFNGSRSRNVAQDYSLAFRRMGRPQVTTISSELRFTKNGNTNNAEFYDAGAAGRAPLPYERDHAISASPSWDLQTDFTHPFSTRTKLETGFKETSRYAISDFTAAYLDTASGAYLPAPARSVNFDYRERIGAVYAVLSQQVSKLGTQAGLRLEEAGTRLNLPVRGERFDRRYASAFPSAILSYNFTPVRQGKLSTPRMTFPHG